MGMRLALNADTTPVAVSDRLVFKSLEQRAREARDAAFPAVNVDRSEVGLRPEKVRALLRRYSLRVASGFFQGRFYRAREEDALLQQAREQARFSRAIGQDCLFVSALVSPPERHARAGRIGPGERFALTEAEFRQMARALERLARLWRPYGITLCYHPHVATYVEAPHEIDFLMRLTDPELVKLGPDTGHLFFGGADPIEVIKKYFDRLGGLHIKDVRGRIVDQVRREGLDYRRACGCGVWTEIGCGDIDFPSLFSFLREKQWSGWVIVETDHTRLPTALESSRVSRHYLREVIGI
ncbi:MAG: sugar phosphate isomerase/epimerase family protein [Acidobacteriota bacterium]